MANTYPSSHSRSYRPLKLINMSWMRLSALLSWRGLKSGRLTIMLLALMLVHESLLSATCLVARLDPALCEALAVLLAQDAPKCLRRSLCAAPRQVSLLHGVDAALRLQGLKVKAVLNGPSLQPGTTPHDTGRHAEIQHTYLPCYT